MGELLRSNDIILLSWIRSVLNEAGIVFFLLDTQTSVLEGSANSIPHRVMVDEEDYAWAIRVLNDAQSEVDGLVVFGE